MAIKVEAGIFYCPHTPQLPGDRNSSPALNITQCKSQPLFHPGKNVSFPCDSPVDRAE